MKWWHKHVYVEVFRYRMYITGEDRVFYRCECGRAKDEYTLDTYNGCADAKYLRDIPDWRRKLSEAGR